MFCGYVAAPAKPQRGKRKKSDLPSAAPPAKASFRSTECLLLSLLRQGTCDETESPMSGVLQSRLAALKGGDGQLGGSRSSLGTAGPRPRSCSLETILDDSAPLTRQRLFQSSESLASSRSQEDGPALSAAQTGLTAASRVISQAAAGGVAASRRRWQRPRSAGSCLDIVVETREEDSSESKWQCRASSCLNVNAPEQFPPSSASRRLPSTSSSFSFSSYHPPLPSATAHKAQGPQPAAGPRAASSTSNLRTLAAPAVVRRCLSSLDVSKPPRPLPLLRAPPASSSQPPQTKPENSKSLSPSPVSACPSTSNHTNAASPRPPC